MSAASCRRRSASTIGKRFGPWPIGVSGLRRNDGEAGAHLPTASWPDLIRPPRQAAAVLGPRVKPADDGEAGAKLDCARSSCAGEDARGPCFRSVMPTKVGIHGRQTLRPCGVSGIPAFAGKTARQAPNWTARALHVRARTPAVHISAASCRRRSASTTGQYFGPAAYRGFRPSPE